MEFWDIVLAVITAKGIIFFVGVVIGSFLKNLPKYKGIKEAEEEYDKKVDEIIDSPKKSKFTERLEAAQKQQESDRPPKTTTEIRY